MIRPGRGAYGYERALIRAGLGPVAGADEAGRGACAGPLVAAAVILNPDRPIKGLDDSKVLTEAARERLYDEILKRAVAVAWSIVGPEECDRLECIRQTCTACVARSAASMWRPTSC